MCCNVVVWKVQKCNPNLFAHIPEGAIMEFLIAGSILLWVYLLGFHIVKPLESAAEPFFRMWPRYLTAQPKCYAHCLNKQKHPARRSQKSCWRFFFVCWSVVRTVAAPPSEQTKLRATLRSQDPQPTFYYDVYIRILLSVFILGGLWSRDTI